MKEQQKAIHLFCTLPIHKQQTHTLFLKDRFKLSTHRSKSFDIQFSIKLFTIGLSTILILNQKNSEYILYTNRSHLVHTW